MCSGLSVASSESGGIQPSRRPGQRLVPGLAFLVSLHLPARCPSRALSWEALHLSCETRSYIPGLLPPARKQKALPAVHHHPIPVI